MSSGKSVLLTTALLVNDSSSEGHLIAFIRCIQRKNEKEKKLFANFVQKNYEMIEEII